MLDSPRWDDLTACDSTPRAIALLRQIVSTGRLGEPWREFHGEIIHQGTVCGVTSAALPHLIRLAPSLTPDEQRDLWIDVGFLVIAGAGSLHGNEPVPGMQETLTQSLRDETLVWLSEARNKKSVTLNLKSSAGAWARQLPTSARTATTRPATDAGSPLPAPTTRCSPAWRR